MQQKACLCLSAIRLSVCDSIGEVNEGNRAGYCLYPRLGVASSAVDQCRSGLNYKTHSLTSIKLIRLNGEMNNTLINVREVLSSKLCLQYANFTEMFVIFLSSAMQMLEWYLKAVKNFST